MLKSRLTRRACSGTLLAVVALVTAAALGGLLMLVVAPTAAQSRSFLWRASKGTGVLYLVGSVHMLSKDSYPLSPALEAAFKESDLLVEELDLAEMMAPESQMAMLTRGMLPAGQTLDTTLSRETLTAVTRQANALGLPMEPLKRFKPWSLALTLLGMAWQRAGFDAELGLDKHFYDRARSERKAVQGLETVAFQISRFDEMSMADQDKLLQQSLREIETETSMIGMLATAWKNGDAAAIERVVLDDVKSDPQMYRRLIVERNQTWLPVLEGLAARPKPAFVVVGAAHLVGPDGMLALFKARGFTLEQR